MTKEFSDEYDKNQYAIIKRVGQSFTITSSEFIRLLRTGHANIECNGDLETIKIIEDNLEE